jgi:hypothetical protein
MYYIIDTNIWIDVAQGKIDCTKFKKPGIELAIAPMMLTELVRGVVKGGESKFPRNRALFDCMAQVASSVLELPKVFMFITLWKINQGVSGVRPHHYLMLINMLIQAKSHAEFLKAAEAPGSPWTKMTRLDPIHEGVLDYELGFLRPLAAKASIKTLQVHMARQYKVSGLLPDPDSFERTFSAAVEFLKSSVAKVRNGANPKKNDRGLYIDSQLFWYLGDADAVIVTNEDFSNEIRVSPQRNRIISLDTFLRL